MRIINQTGTRSINFDNCEVYVDSECICTSDRGVRDVLGRYETPERAKEVFEEIHRALMPVMVCNNVEPTEELLEEIRKAGIQHGISVVDGESPKIEIISPFIYRMPKE